MLRDSSFDNTNYVEPENVLTHPCCHAGIQHGTQRRLIDAVVFDLQEPLLELPWVSPVVWRVPSTPRCTRCLRTVCSCLCRPRAAPASEEGQQNDSLHLPAERAVASQLAAHLEERGKRRDE